MVELSHKNGFSIFVFFCFASRLVSFALIKGWSIGFCFFFFVFYRMLHFIFFRDFFPSLPVLLPSESIFRARISLIRSKKTLSTFSRVLAEVSTYGTFQASAWARALARGTARRSVRSLLFPTRINGMVSSPLTRRICSRNSWVDWKKREEGKLVLAKVNYCGKISSERPILSSLPYQKML